MKKQGILKLLLTVFGVITLQSTTAMDNSKETPQGEDFHTAYKRLVTDNEKLVNLRKELETELNHSNQCKKAHKENISDLKLLWKYKNAKQAYADKDKEYCNHHESLVKRFNEHWQKKENP